MTMNSLIRDDESRSSHMGSMLGQDPRQATRLFPSLVDEAENLKDSSESDLWEIHRPTIKKLYLDEGRTLKDVMAIMRQDYGHKATVKMYKNRFTMWNFGKNNRAKEMEAIARKKLERDALGKASVFQIRGQQIEIRDVFKYFKRRGYKSLEEVVARDNISGAETLPDIGCSTPPSSTLLQCTGTTPMGKPSMTRLSREEVLTRNGSSPSQISKNKRLRRNSPIQSSGTAARQLLWMSDELRQLSSLNHVSPSLVPPQDHLIPESIFSAVKNLFQGSLEGELWTADNDGYLAPKNEAMKPGSGRYAIWDFQDNCEAAVSLLEQKMFVEARQVLSKACEKCGDVIKEGHARTLPILFDLYFRFEHAGYGHAAIKVFEHLESMASLSTCCRPVSRLLRNTLFLKQKVGDVYFIAWRCCEDILERHLEPFSRTWLASRLDYSEKIGSRGNWPEAERLLRSLSRDCEQYCGKSDPRSWEILVRLGWILHYQGKCEEAEKLGQAVVQQAENAKEEYLFFRWTIKAFNLVSNAQFAQFKHGLARNSLQYCIEMATRAYGKQDSRTLRYSLRLEKWLLGWGYEDEAEVLATQRSQLLGPPEIEELCE